MHGLCRMSNSLCLGVMRSKNIVSIIVRGVFPLLSLIIFYFIISLLIVEEVFAPGQYRCKFCLMLVHKPLS